MNSSASLTWVGHATTVIDVGGHRVLTDPLLRRRVAHLRRRVGRPSPADADVDLVLISHAHMDHLHVPSLRRVRADAPVVAPRGTARLLARAGRREVIEVVAGDRIEVGSASITVTPAVHPGGRGTHSRIVAEPVGYVVEVDGHRTYFAGDTDLFDEMGELGPVDLALLPIWGWGPSIGVGHLDPDRAVEAAARIAPGLVVPIHWGTFAPEDFRRRPPSWLGEPARAFSRAVDRVGGPPTSVVEPGTTLSLDDPGSTPVHPAVD
jgi:L-ascorbate metabolism protein UlaG (beta-lactamase superfamily)